jgi:polar amino acid transport system substrate-binding protein
MYKFCGLIFAFIGFLFPFKFASAQQTLVIATNIYPPYVNEDVGNSFLPALIREVGRAMDVKFDLQIQPWRRCEQSVTDLEAWGAIPYTPSLERQLRYLFSEPLYVADSKLFAYRHPKKSSAELPPVTYAKLSDLQNSRVGGVQGYYYEELFERAGIAGDYILSEVQGFELLKLDRIDLFPANTTVGWHTIRSLFPPEIAENFYTLDKPLVADGTLHLMTSKDYPDNDLLLARFNDALTEVKSNGTFARLVDEYGLVLRY